ncbi:hypothetical protein GGR51DRAFT_559591 [Nemania sp. FL0031]|nr:hypothetical protein GGR51DRAFT_559591 [Nemania sp. FL0031]
MSVNSDNGGGSPGFKTPAQESLEAHLRPSSKTQSSTTPNGSPIPTTSFVSISVNMSGSGSIDDMNGSGSPTPTSSIANMSREGSPTPTVSTAGASSANASSVNLVTATELSPHLPHPHSSNEHGHEHNWSHLVQAHSLSETSMPESEQFWTTSIPRSAPIDIPGAVNRESPLPFDWEPPIRFEPGGLAEITHHLVEPHRDIEAVLAAMDTHYEGLKAGIQDWAAKEKEKGTCDKGPVKKVIPSPDHKNDQKNDDANDSDSTDDPLVPEEDVRVGNAIMLGKETVPEYTKFFLQPYSHSYAHTAAALAYEEGRKSRAYKDGYMTGLANIRYKREYNLGYEQALRQYGHPPEPYRPRPKAEPVTRPQRATRSPIVQQDGSLLSHKTLVEEVRKLMDTLNIPRADFYEQLEYYNETGKKKEQRPRTSFEIAEFAKDMAFELSMDE